MTAVMNTYGRLPIAFSHGQGIWLYDNEGKQYLDALGGIAVCALGHAHPAVTKAITTQANTLLHTSNLFNIPAQTALANKLCAAAGMDNVFFSNSGAEANEAAIKLARKFGNNKGINTPTIIVTDNAFHGRTLATLTATGNRKVHAGFEPLVRGFVRAPFNDIPAIETIAKNNSSVVAIMVEPIQGEAGIILPDTGYISALRAIADKYDLLLILDEIQTGVGRTGKFFACQHEGVTPDVLTSAKALGNGVPIGACMTSGKAKDLFAPGNHGSTFGGNPLSCAAANAVVDTVLNDNLCDRATELGELITQRLKTELSDCDYVSNIRGKGLMIALDVAPEYTNLMQHGLNNNIVLNVTGNNSIRLLPPYILSDDEAHELVTRVINTLRNTAKNT